jgi:hypothetical protein
LSIFTYKELNTILAALRQLQSDIEENGADDLIAAYPHFDDVGPLTAREINCLCEAMYSGHAGIVENDRLTDMMDDASSDRQWVKLIARHDTTEDFERRGSVMENNGAVDSINRLIPEASDLVPREVCDSARDSGFYSKPQENNMDRQDDVMATTSYGQIALQKMAPTPANFRLFYVEWLGDKPKDWTVMKVIGAEFRAAKSGPNKGKLSAMVKGTKRTAYVTCNEMLSAEQAI